MTLKQRNQCNYIFSHYWNRYFSFSLITSLSLSVCLSVYQSIYHPLLIYFLSLSLFIFSIRWLYCLYVCVCVCVCVYVCVIIAQEKSYIIFRFGWVCRIQRLILCRGVRTPNKCPGYDTKQYDSEVPVMLELYGMLGAPPVHLPDPCWSSVVLPDRVQCMGQILPNCVHMLNWIVWNRTVLPFNFVNKRLYLN